MRGPFVLAYSSARPDLTFRTIGALARAIVAVRYAAPGRPAIRLRRSCLGRGALPNGVCVSIRLERPDREPGDLVGYAFLPGDKGREQDALAAAVREAEPARAAA